MVQLSEFLTSLLCESFFLRNQSCHDSLVEYLSTDKGRKELNSALSDMSIGPLLMFLCVGINHRSKNIGIIQMPGGGDMWRMPSTLRVWLSEAEGKSTKLKPSDACVDQLSKYLFDKYRCYSFGTFVGDSNEKREKGWLRYQSMDLVERFPPAIAINKKIKMLNGRLRDVEKCVLRAHICLLLLEKGQDTDALLAYAWGSSPRVVMATRLSLRNLLSPKEARQRDNAIGPMSPSFKSPPSKKTKGNKNVSPTILRIATTKVGSRSNNLAAIDSIANDLAAVNIIDIPTHKYATSHLCERRLPSELTVSECHAFDSNTVAAAPLPTYPKVGSYNNFTPTEAVNALDLFVSDDLFRKQTHFEKKPPLCIDTTMYCQGYPAIVTPTEELDDVDAVDLLPWNQESEDLEDRLDQQLDEEQGPEHSFFERTILVESSKRVEYVRAILVKAQTTHCAKVLVQNADGGKRVHFVEVPKSSCSEQWLIYARKKGWLEEALRISTKGTIDVEEAAICAIVAISRQHKEAYEEAGRRLGYWSVLPGPMDVHTAASMWNMAGVTKSAQRVIKRFIHGYYGLWITPSERRIDALVSHTIAPTHGVATVGEQKITFWYKDVDTVVVNLLENEWKQASFKYIDIVFGGDHGQGVFGAAIKVILWDSNWRIVESTVLKVGHIDCTKDTYEVLEATIAAPLNESLKRVQGKQLCLLRQDDDRIAMFCDEEDVTPADVRRVDPFSEEAAAAAAQDSNSGPNGSDIESQHGVHVYGVGDLAFISMVLGRVNMDGCWCYLCDLAPAEWSIPSHTQGVPWTLFRMQEKLRKLERGELRDNPSNRRGCVKRSLLEVLEPFDFIPPCLHIMMGAFNDALKNLLKYIDERHEKISAKEEEKRNAFWSAETAFVNANKELVHFSERVKQEGLQKNEEIDALKVKRGTLNPPGSISKFLYNHEQKQVFSVQIAALKESLAALQTNEKMRKNEVSTKRAIRDAAKKALHEERKKRKTVDSAVRQQIEQLLMSHGIDRGASHGGELTGVSCLVMEERIVPLLESIRTCLKSIDGSKVPPPQEVDDVMESYEIHFLLLSKVFSLARTERHVFKDPFRKASILADLRKTIGLVNISTARLGMSMRTPKRHICDDHLVGFIDTHDGIAEYVEDWLEQIHQTYKKISSRGKIRSKETKGYYESKQEAIRLNVGVIEAAKVMVERTKRSFRHERTDQKSAAERQKQARKERRAAAVERAEILFATKPILLGTTSAINADNHLEIV